MPVLPQNSSIVTGLYDPVTESLGGIPMEKYANLVVAKSRGDFPKGFELPTCLVPNCCDETASLEITSFTVSPLSDDAFEKTFTLQVTNLGGTELIGVTLLPISLATIDSPAIASGDTDIEFGPVTIAAGATETFVFIAGYAQSVSGTVTVTITIPAGAITSSEGASNPDPASVVFELSQVV